MKILDGKAVAEAKKAQIKADVEGLKSRSGKTPGLAVVIVGSDPASQVYVSNKAKMAKELGMHSIVMELPESSTKSDVASKIATLNLDKTVSAILLQLPLPKHLDSRELIEGIDPLKDPDCLTADNVGRFHLGVPRTQPCTPSGVIEILKHYKLPIEGKSALVIGRSHIVGQPMGQLLLNENATVTIAHSKTTNLKELVRVSDIVVVAAGKPEFLSVTDFKSDAVIVDVGIHRVERDGKTQLVGDVKRDAVAEAKMARASITPVPGGVGPMTIQMLMQNTVKLASLSVQ